MINKIVLILILILTINFSYWFTCNNDWTAEDNTKKAEICEKTPDVINNYIQDYKYIISIIWNSWNNNEDKEWLWWKVFNNIWWSYKTNEEIFTDFWIDFFNNFKILFEDKYIVRDWTKLINLKQYITKKVSNSVLSLSLSNTIEKNKLTQIRNYIKQKDSFIIPFIWNSYKELYHYLRVNQQIVEYIYYNIIVKWDEKVDLEKKLKNRWDEFWISKDHLNSFVEKIKKDYFKEWKTPSCNKRWDSFILKFKEVVCKYWVHKTNTAIDRFECNYRRLRNALYWENTNIAWCGRNKIITEPVQNRIVWLWQWKIQKTATEFKNFIDDTEKLWNNIADMFKTEEVTSNIQVENTQRPKEIFKNMLITNIANTSEELVKAKATSAQDFTNIEASRYTHNITKQIVEAINKSYKIRVELDWADNWEEDSTEWYLVETCLNQSPHWGKCKKSRNK